MHDKPKSSRRKFFCTMGGIVAALILCGKIAALLPKEPTFWGQSMVSMKLDIEASDGITYTYILKFLDKDVKINNGKVVE